MTTTQTIPADAGYILTTDLGEQLFVRVGTDKYGNPTVELAEGEWDPAINDLDTFCAVYALRPVEAQVLALALLEATKKAVPEVYGAPEKEA